MRKAVWALALLTPVLTAGPQPAPAKDTSASDLLLSSVRNMDEIGVNIALKRGAKPAETPKLMSTLANQAWIDENKTPAMLAKIRKLAARLLSLGARFEKDDLFCFIVANDKALLRLALSNGLDPHQRVYGRSSVETAFIYGAEDLIPLLLERKVSPIPPEDLDYYRLVRAAKNWKADEVLSLLSKGVDPNRYDSSGKTPLLMALDFQSINSVTARTLFVFLNPAVDWNLPSRYEDDTGAYPLHLLARFMVHGGDDYAVLLADVIKAAVERHHANPNARDSLQQTPLHRLARSRFASPAACRALLDAGADPNARNYRNSKPSDLAEVPEIRRMLLEAEQKKR